MANTQTKSGICIGTIGDKGNLRVLLRIPAGIEGDYQSVVLSGSPTQDGSAEPPGTSSIDVPLSRFGDDGFLAIAASFTESEEPRTLYAYLLSNVGTYKAFDEGSPVSFYFKGYKPKIETDELGDGRFRLSIYDLEQAFSKQNYNSIIVTKEKVEDGTSSDDLPPWWISFPCTSSTSTKVDVSFLSDAFSEGTYYVYKNTKFGLLYLIGKAKFESSQEPDVDAGDCKIEYKVIDRQYYESSVSGVEAYVDNYIDITGEAWRIFCDAINVARETVGLIPVEFTTGDMLSAIMWNEAIEAFADVADATGSYFDVERFTVSRGDPVTKELIDEVNADIAAVIELLT